MAYGVGYLALLKAWELVPSTVIVPCLQLSSPLVAILAAAAAPWHDVDAILAPLAGSTLRWRDLCAFVLVLFGGVLPSAVGAIADSIFHV